MPFGQFMKTSTSLCITYPRSFERKHLVASAPDSGDRSGPVGPGGAGTLGQRFLGGHARIVSHVRQCTSDAHFGNIIVLRRLTEEPRGNYCPLRQAQCPPAERYSHSRRASNCVRAYAVDRICVHNSSAAFDCCHRFVTPHRFRL